MLPTLWGSGTPALAMVMVLSAATVVGAAPPEHPVTVLLVYAETRTLPGVKAQDEALRTALQARLPHGIFFHTEYLDPTPASAPAQSALVDPPHG
jgi:hypothetical protein